MKFGNGHIKCHGPYLFRLHHNSHIDGRPLPRLAGPINMPTAIHQHVSEQGQAAGKIHAHPLSLRFNYVDSATRSFRIKVDAEEFWKDSFETRYGLSRKRFVERARRP